MTEFGKANDVKVLMPVIHLELFCSIYLLFLPYTCKFYRQAVLAAITFGAPFLVINPSSEVTGFVNNFGWVEQHMLIASAASAEFFSLLSTTDCLQNHTNSADLLPEIISTFEPLNHNSAVTDKDGIFTQ